MPTYGHKRWNYKSNRRIEMNADLAVIIPTRNRPQVVKEIIETYKETCRANTTIYFSVDVTDTHREEYEEAAKGTYLIFGDNLSMVEALNNAAKVILKLRKPFALMFAGDDHRPRTIGWDSNYLAELKKLKTGMVYGNDLFQGQNIPTQIAMTSDIVKALGYMALPTLKHLYLDNWWLELGAATNCITYLNDTIIEHMHPAAGKAEIDDNYIRVNAEAIASHDHQKLLEWRSTAMLNHINIIKGLQEK